MNAIEYAIAVDAFTNTIRVGAVRKSLIDSLGITVRLSDLPSCTEYESIRDRHYCGKLKKTLRRLLFPSLHCRIGREFIAAQARLQAEFLNAVMERCVE